MRQLDVLIEQPKKDAITYQECLARIAELTRNAKNPSARGKYPKTREYAWKRALKDNLGATRPWGVPGTEPSWKQAGRPEQQQD
jgi:hypothetical protein